MGKVISIQAIRSKKVAPLRRERIWVRSFKDMPTANSITKIEVTPKDLFKFPCLVAMANDGEYVFPLTNEFELYYCNEMLKSLETGLEVYFSTFVQYFTLAERCNEILQNRAAGNVCAVIPF